MHDIPAVYANMAQPIIEIEVLRKYDNAILDEHRTAQNDGSVR